MIAMYVFTLYVCVYNLNNSNKFAVPESIIGKKQKQHVLIRNNECGQVHI